MNKLISTSILATILLAVPLLAQPAYLLHPHFLLVVFFFYLLFFTQPTFEANDIKAKADTDKYSMLLITLGLVISLTGSIIDWAYITKAATRLSFSNIQYIGLTLLIVGSTIRIVAIRHLGQYFTNAVNFSNDHQLVTTGLYSLVRHPSYLGAYIAILGSTLMLSSVTLFAVSIVLLFFIYNYRIKVEEEGLIKTFPEAYILYQSKSKRWIPWIY